MIKKIIFHLLILGVILLSISLIGNKIDKLNPISKAINEIRFSDIYFSFTKNIKPSTDIYIVDIGNKSSKVTRSEISKFIETINLKFKPKVIGVDVYFDSKFKDEKINNRLVSSLSSDNVIRMFKVTEQDYFPNGKRETVISPDFSMLPGITTNSEAKDGYTFGLGDATMHPCIRYYKPTYKIDGVNYHHLSKLIAEKYLDEKLINFDEKKMINYNTDFSNNRIDINDSTRYHELKDKIVLIGLNSFKEDGTPLYNDDIHFTPRNPNYIGRSSKDTYGIEILSQITSNIINDDHLLYNESFVKWLNWIISISVYCLLLFIFRNFNDYYLFIKIFFQSIGVILLLSFSIFIISKSNYYIDLSMSIGLMIVFPELIRIVETISTKLNNL